MTSRSSSSCEVVLCASDQKALVQEKLSTYHHELLVQSRIGLRTLSTDYNAVGIRRISLDASCNSCSHYGSCCEVFWSESALLHFRNSSLLEWPLAWFSWSGPLLISMFKLGERGGRASDKVGLSSRASVRERRRINSDRVRGLQRRTVLENSLSMPVADCSSAPQIQWHDMPSATAAEVVPLLETLQDFRRTSVLK